jgi:hypothetical protein
MSQPPYHLRQNKAVDRLAFVDAIRRLSLLDDLAGYTYYSLGGPYLEDFRLLYEFFPDMKLVSIEIEEEIYRRQEFHLPCGNLTLHNTDLASFLAAYQANDQKSIFWLDNVGLEFGHFETFMTLLGKVSANSMIKITLDASTKKHYEKADEFRRIFGAVMPDPAATPPVEVKPFATLLQSMIRVAAERALPGAVPLMFHPVSSFYYQDGAPMFTLTGVVCRRDATGRVVRAFQGLRFANLDWSEPKKIDLPVLTTKERLHLQRLLPLDAAADAGRILREALGYLIEDTQGKTEQRLAQYAEYHRYSPYFIRGIP